MGQSREVFAVCENEVDSLDLPDVVDRIVTLTAGLRDFWSSAHGWAPVEAAQLLSKSRLDWQVDLAGCLREVLPEWRSQPMTNGHLILAWANLGALVEGTLKLFLSVFYSDYSQDVDAVRKKGGKLVDPDAFGLEQLRQFFAKRIWEKGEDWDEWVSRVQRRRNAIHAFRNRDIGTFDDLYSDIRRYLALLRRINGQLPYPDDICEPREKLPWAEG